MVEFVVVFAVDSVGHENAIEVARVVPGRRRATSDLIRSGHESATGSHGLGWLKSQSFRNRFLLILGWEEMFIDME